MCRVTSPGSLCNSATVFLEDSTLCAPLRVTDPPTRATCGISLASWCTTTSRSLITFVAKDAEHIVFQLHHRVIVPMFLKAGAYFLAFLNELRCFVCLNVEHDFSLTSMTIEVSVAKHFHTQLLIREFYPHVALICKWQGINTDDVLEENFQELVDTC